MPNIKDQIPRDDNGNKHGEWLVYYNNGKLCYRRNYVHGALHGLCEGYNRHGKLDYRVYFNMDIMIGYWYWYNEKKYYLCLI